MGADDYPGEYLSRQNFHPPMRPLTCMIVDDEPLAVRLLESYVEKTPDLKLLASYTDSITAVNAVKEQKPNLLFLDIQMPNIDGMALADARNPGPTARYCGRFAGRKQCRPAGSRGRYRYRA